VRILALNCGSSSIKCAVVDGATGARPFQLSVENIGREDARILVGDTARALEGRPEASAAVDAALAELRARWPELGEIGAVVHRVVHGGEHFSVPTIVDDAVMRQLGDLAALAPLHNPPAIRAIRGARELFARIPHVAVFDTAFHATLPPHAREYALPADIRARFGVRRFGFHGISHGGVATRVAALLHRNSRELRIVSCHLGNGASVTAIDRGRSVDTSMGMTPLEGLVMGTRSGDLDPGAMIELARRMTPAALDDLLNGKSGLVGLTGTQDLRAIEERASRGDADCKLALDLYVHRLRKYVGGYAAVLGGIDAIVFTGGVGERSAWVRERCVAMLGFLGATIDDQRNRDARVDAAVPAIDVASAQSRVRIVVLRADEEFSMATAAASILENDRSALSYPRIPIAVSARHVHLSEDTLSRVFGPGHHLHSRRDLSQTGQFAARETVKLIGPRGRLDNVRVVGPPRERDQIEISRSDEIELGIDAPVRLSGDLAETPGIIIEGPEGRVTLPHGVICAQRHVHMNPDDARRLGVANRDVVAVRIGNRGRDLLFEDVRVRIAPQFKLELHLDTDEANAAEVANGDCAELILKRPTESARHP
jgi:acetate kinase